MIIVNGCYFFQTIEIQKLQNKIHEYETIYTTIIKFVPIQTRCLKLSILFVERYEKNNLFSSLGS